MKYRTVKTRLGSLATTRSTEPAADLQYRAGQLRDVPVLRQSGQQGARGAGPDKAWRWVSPLVPNLTLGFPFIILVLYRVQQLIVWRWILLLTLLSILFSWWLSCWSLCLSSRYARFCPHFESTCLFGCEACLTFAWLSSRCSHPCCVLRINIQSNKSILWLLFNLQESFFFFSINSWWCVGSMCWFKGSVQRKLSWV